MKRVSDLVKWGAAILLSLMLWAVMFVVAAAVVEGLFA